MKAETWHAKQMESLCRLWNVPQILDILVKNNVARSTFIEN